MDPLCDYCQDTGHAGGNLNDPNQCGWCDKEPIPSYPDTGSWEFFFMHDGRARGFSRFNLPYEDALEQAKHGFQWSYGYWPSAPVKVLEITR